MTSVNAAALMRVEQLRQRDDRDPSHRDVEEPAHASQPVDVELLHDDPGDGAGPYRGQHDHAPGAAQRQQAQRGVRSGDQHEDHRVVEAFHPLPGRIGPRHPVIRGARPEHPNEAGREDDGSEPRLPGVGQGDQGDPRRDRDEEGDLMERAAHPRLHGRFHTSSVPVPPGRTTEARRLSRSRFC